MKKAIYTLAILTSVVFASCNSALKDDIDDLEANLTELQTENDALQAEIDAVSGDLNNTNQTLDDSVISAIKGIKYSHDYSHNTGKSILEEGTFFGTTNQTALMRETSNDNEYFVQTSVSDNSGFISINFYYNTATEEVDFSSFNYNLDNNIYDDRVDASDDAFNPVSNITTTLTLNSFNVATGEISFTLVGDYTAAYIYSEYDTAGKLTLSFDGTVRVIEEEPSTSNLVVALPKLDASK